MKITFDALYHRRPKDKFKLAPFTFVNMSKSHSVKQVDHPSDFQLDYNELVDDLEEEHCRRDVFTTDQAQKGGDTKEEQSIESDLDELLLEESSQKNTKKKTLKRDIKAKQKSSEKKRKLNI